MAALMNPIPGAPHSQGMGRDQFQPIQAYSTYSSPEELAQTQDAVMRSGLVNIEALPKPAQTVAHRLPAETLDRYYQAWEQAKSAEIQEQYQASRYYHGKQWTDAELRILKQRKQPITTKNRIKRKVDFLVGVEQRLRRDPKCYPRTPAAEKAAPISTACLRSVEDETRWQAIASAATKDALIRGVGVIWSGAKIVRGRAEVRKSHIPSDRFFYDPCSEAWDFSDARYLGEWQWADMDEATELLPFAAPMIENLATVGQAGALSILPQEFSKSHNWTTWVDAKKRMIRLVSIWYKCRGNWMFDYLVGPVSLCPEGHDCKSPYVGEDDNTEHPYLAWSPYVDESGHRYGVVRDMMPLQDGINKRSSKMLHMLNVRQTMSTAGAVDDVEKAKAELHKPDGHIVVNHPEGFQILDQTAQTQGQFELLQEDKAEIENLGPNPGLLGRGVENQSGKAILAQQNSGMTELSPVFENLREWKLAVYHKDWRLIRQFWTGERYIRVTGDPRAVEFLSVNRIVEDPNTGQVQVENAIAEMDVDVILDEGPDTVTMREELMEQLAQLGPGVVPPELLIELSNIGEKDMILKRLKEAKAPPPELVEIQGKLARLEVALNATKVDESIANVENKRAATIKTMVEAGATPDVIRAVFPLQYSDPTTLQAIYMAGSPQRQNAMMPDAGPEGQRDQPGGAIGLPSPPPAMIGEDTQIDQPGGLPLGPGVQ
jgi:hypothetical protein